MITGNYAIAHQRHRLPASTKFLRETMIHRLNMTDTEYAQLAAQGYDPNLELQLIELGETQQQARKLTRIVGLVQQKPPTTDEDWEKFMEVWENE